MPDFLVHWITTYGYAGIFFLLMWGIIGIPVPDETLLTLTGYLVYKGDLHILPGLAAIVFGSVCGISLSYGLGRTGGFMLVKKYGHYLHLSADKLEKAHDFLVRRGKWALMFGYFIPGVRHLTALVAGTTRLTYPLFALFAYSGALVWCATFFTTGYFLGKEWTRASAKIHHGILVGFSAAACGFLGFHLVYRYRRMHGRRSFFRRF